MTFKNYLQIVGLLMVAIACTYHSEEAYFEENGCKTTKLSYAEDIRPILETSCVSCHNADLAYADIDLSSYEQVALHAKSGILVSVVKHETGFKAMPADQPKLDDCTIAKLEAWVADGFKNN